MNNVDIDIFIIFPMGIFFFNAIICFSSSSSHWTSSFFGTSCPFLYVPIKYTIRFLELDMSFIICIKNTFLRMELFFHPVHPVSRISRSLCYTTLLHPLLACRDQLNSSPVLPFLLGHHFPHISEFLPPAFIKHKPIWILVIHLDFNAFLFHACISGIKLCP